MPDFEKKQAEEEAAGRKARLEDAPPLGALPDGTIACYPPGQVPEPEQKIVYGDARDDEPVEGEYEDGADLED